MHFYDANFVSVGEFRLDKRKWKLAIKVYIGVCFVWRRKYNSGIPVIKS